MARRRNSERRTDVTRRDQEQQPPAWRRTVNHQWFVQIAGGVLVAVLLGSLPAVRDTVGQTWDDLLGTSDASPCAGYRRLADEASPQPRRDGEFVVLLSARRRGDERWQNTASVVPGDTVEWRLEVRNGTHAAVFGTTANVLLPPHLSEVPASALWYTAEQCGVPFDLDQLEISAGAGGFDFGNYAANGGNLFVRFDTVAGGGFATCETRVRASARAWADGVAEVADDADVIIGRSDC